MLTGTELTTVFTALSLVYQAYSKIRSNKERCRRVLKRCQTIVDHLQDTRHRVEDDQRIAERIRILERTFRRSADAIKKVGQQSWLKSILKSEENTSLIDDTQHELTSLVTVLNLEQTIDVSTWQKEYESARVQDHHTLMSVGARLEQSNVVILTELTRQGASLAQLSAVMKSLREESGQAVELPPVIADDDDVSELLDEGVPRPRAMSAPASSKTVQQAIPVESNALSRTLSTSFSGRRPSWASKIHIPAIKPMIRRLSSSALPPSSSSLSNGGNLTPGTEGARTPPPPYEALSDELKTASDMANNNSTIATLTTPPRSPQYPCSTPGEENTSQESSASPGPASVVKKVRFAIDNIDLQTSDLSSAGSYGYFNRRVVVELWAHPKHLSFSMAVPLSHFAPIHNDNIAIVTQKAGDIGRSLRPMLHRRNSKRTSYTHVFMLCPKDEKPFVVQMKRNQQRPQHAVKAYILNCTLQVTVVSVRHGNEKELFLIPYFPNMSILHAKSCIEDFFQNAHSVTAIRASKRETLLSDDETLASIGIKPYSNQLRMTIA